MAKVRIMLDLDEATTRVTGLFINGVMIESNDAKEMRKRKKALKVEKKLTGVKTKTSLLGWTNLDLKEKNVIEIKEMKIKLGREWKPAKKQTHFSCKPTSKVQIKVSNRNFLTGLIFGKFAVSVKVK